jgi:branched-subunit amino acid transport protein
MVAVQLMGVKATPIAILITAFVINLRLVPAVVFPALLAPALLFRDGMLAVSLGNGRLIAGIMAVIVARSTKNLPLTVVLGMTTLCILQAIAAGGS